jgi:hypothetical protein
MAMTLAVMGYYFQVLTHRLFSAMEAPPPSAATGRQPLL